MTKSITQDAISAINAAELAAAKNKAAAADFRTKSVVPAVKEALKNGVDGFIDLVIAKKVSAIKPWSAKAGVNKTLAVAGINKVLAANSSVENLVEQIALGKTGNQIAINYQA